MNRASRNDMVFLIVTSAVFLKIEKRAVKRKSSGLSGGY
jgi:hypothetical protein